MLLSNSSQVTMETLRSKYLKVSMHKYYVCAVLFAFAAFIFQCSPSCIAGPHGFSFSSVEGSLKHWGVRVDAEKADAYSMNLDPDVLYHRIPSACLKSTPLLTYPERSFGILQQKFDAQDYKGKRVRLSCVAKTDGDGKGSMWMKIDGKDGTLAFDGMKDRLISGKTDWKKYSIVLDVPETSKQIGIGFSYKGKGSMWVNSPGFEIVGNDVKTSSRPLSESAVFTEQLPSRPENPKFEAFNAKGDIR
ncbi:MAG: hypothetical protein K2X81_12155, partial [Candidatus Obscuribacterales bacterium]|nr:hypothetical protein [Candidatus Obscuribacterales bacterium]